MNHTPQLSSQATEPLMILLYGEHGLTSQGAQIIKALRSHHAALHVLTDADLHTTIDELHLRARKEQSLLREDRFCDCAPEVHSELAPLTHVPNTFFNPGDTQSSYAQSVMIFCTHNPDEINPLFATLKAFGCSTDIQTVLTSHNKEWTLETLLEHTKEEHALVGDFIKLSGLTREVSKFMDMFEIPEDHQKTLKELLNQAFAVLKSEEEPNHEHIYATHQALRDTYLSLTKRSSYTGSVVLEVTSEGEGYSVHAQPSEAQSNSFKITWSDGEEGAHHSLVPQERLASLTCNAYALGDLHGVITGIRLHTPPSVPADMGSWHEIQAKDGEVQFGIALAFQGDKIKAALDEACDPLKNMPQPTHLVVRICSEYTRADNECMPHERERTDDLALTHEHDSTEKKSAANLNSAYHYQEFRLDLNEILNGEYADSSNEIAQTGNSQPQISLMSTLQPHHIVVAFENCVGTGNFTLIARSDL